MSKQAVDFIIDRLSFKGTFRILKTRLPECDPGDEVKLSKWYETLIWEISEERILGRCNHITPRVIKRKRSRWNKCCVKHRKRKPPDENHCPDCGYASLNGIAFNAQPEAPAFVLAGPSGWAINKGVEHAAPSTSRYRHSAQKNDSAG